MSGPQSIPVSEISNYLSEFQVFGELRLRWLKIIMALDDHFITLVSKE